MALVVRNDDTLPVPTYVPILAELDRMRAALAEMTVCVRRLETVTLLQLHAMGITDQEIADELGGISSQAVGLKRRRRI